MGTDDLSMEHADETGLAIIEEQADALIRRQWHDGRWFFSVIDLVGVLTDSATPRRYWTDMKRRIQAEGFRELYAKCVQLRLQSADGKYYRTDAADTETVLRIVQSIPSPKAEPIKQWLAKIGAQRVEEATQPLPPTDVSTEIATLARPTETAPALDWASYYEHLAALYRRQATYEAQLADIDATLDEHTEEIGELHSRVEGMEAGLRLLPEILERLGPQTLSAEHQHTIQATAKRLHERTGAAYATIYGELNQAFHVPRYTEIPDGRWTEVAEWFRARLVATEQRKSSEGGTPR